MHNIFIQGLFVLNKERIAKTLCVQKEVENNKCGGCCQLKKSLAKENTSEGKMTAEQKQCEMISFATILIQHDNISCPLLPNLLYPDMQAALCQGALNAVYHPPDMAS